MRPILIATAALAVVAAAPVAARAQPSGDLAFRAMLKEMVETDTSVATGDCTALVARVAARMTAAGFPAGDLHVFVPEGAPKAGNLVAVLPGKDPRARAVLMLGHIDVVNARREDWTRDPFTLIEEDGQLFGRGVSDMKAQDAIWADNMVRYHNEGYRPARTIKLALTCGEEGGFVNGAAWLAQNQRALIDAGIALTEGGGGALGADGRRPAVTVMAAEKIFANYTLEVTGPGGHSSLPRPENPIVSLGQAVANLKSLNFPTELNAFNRAYFTALAPRVGGETGAAMRTVLADPQDPAANAVLNRSVAYRAMLRTTCIPTLIEGGHAANAQPQRARATINCRLPPGTPLAPVEAAIVAAVNDPQVKVTGTPAGPSRAPASPLTPQVMAPIEAVAAAVFPGVPVTPMQETFGTDAGRLIAVGIPTYGFSALFRGDDAGNIHGLNEHIAVQSVMHGREFLYRLIKAYADQK
ncbi:M20/M25/M40 family metallo-hydrolase [Phenylobacterium sp.]|uniref:M20/M25/M40 family metallo-hydrolase n=1 Tax=Phenylobacterium sp. TaxID=1871053 RepID=UPI0025D4D0A0|nr:M20/M25/M40 family metallo-hydrolase [Phenylobacterium sp.]